MYLETDLTRTVATACPVMVAVLAECCREPIAAVLIAVAAEFAMMVFASVFRKLAGVPAYPQGSVLAEFRFREAQ